MYAVVIILINEPLNHVYVFSYSYKVFAYNRTVMYICFIMGEFEPILLDQTISSKVIFIYEILFCRQKRRRRSHIRSTISLSPSLSLYIYIYTHLYLFIFLLCPSKDIAKRKSLSIKIKRFKIDKFRSNNIL